MCRSLLGLLFITCVGFSGFSQTFRFNQYTTEHGISQNFIYTIEQDQTGYLWVGTGEGLCKFEGRNFITYTTVNGLAENVITCSHIDAENRLWLGHNEGGVSVMENDKFTSFKEAAISESMVTDITSVGSDIVFVTQNDGIFILKNGEIEEIATGIEASFYSVVALDDKNLVVGTNNGLVHLALISNTWNIRDIYQEGKSIMDIAVSHAEGIFLMAVELDAPMRFKLDAGKLLFSKWDESEAFSKLAVRTILEDDKGNIWLGTYGQGMIKVLTDSLGLETSEKINYNTTTGLSSDYVKSIYQDLEGNIWVGTFGAGLSTLIDDFFTFYALEPGEYGNSVSSILINGSESWFGVENGLIRISPSRVPEWQFYTDTNSLVNDRISALCLYDSSLWIGTEAHGMYQMNLRNDDVQRISWKMGSLMNSVNQITTDGDLIWVATDGGVVIDNPITGYISTLTTETGLPHNSINAIYYTREGQMWVGTHSRSLYQVNAVTPEPYSLKEHGELDVVSITQAPDGFLWVATAQNGVYKLTGTSFEAYSTTNGLKSNYCYAISCDANGMIWVGHLGALSKINPVTGTILTYDQKSGITDQVNPNAMFLDEKKYLWIGTAGGAIKYDAAKDVINSVPPLVNITTVLIGDKAVDVTEDIVLPYGDYRIHFEFVGISFTDPEHVTYKFQLVGRDEIYSDLTQVTTATYGRVSDGEYVFNVIACNEDGVCTPTPAQIRIFIAAPIWKKWWFYMLLVIALGSIIAWAIRFRLNRLKAIQVYLKKELNKKTKEVVEKAEVIEEINKNLTDSIAYAQRIQSSILPDRQVLLEALPDSFIFFLPKDVVSGDFYFVEEIDNRLIVACADCTGHGVPGAFMSMIGAVTLRNIYKRAHWGWKTPDKVLEELDTEIEEILRQQSLDLGSDEEFFKSRDGMDIMICEIDLQTHEVLIASAMRSAIVRNGRESTIISGDRRAIGGGYGSINKSFSLGKFTLNKGDALFLFTDGFTDQFGGQGEGKLKFSGAQQIVDGLKTVEPSAYEEFIKNQFTEWQGDYEQIDDVLFMGLMF